MKLIGLTDDEVKLRQEEFGKNDLFTKKKESFIKKIVDVIKEPMFILLILAATIYFFLGEPRDGAIMLIFVLAMITIETIQEWKTDKTLRALKDLSSPKIDCIRNGEIIKIDSVDLVPDDIMILYEGVKIPADGQIIDTQGLCIDESSLTGESEGKWKKTFNNEEDEYFKSYKCYAGTTCLQGKAYVRVTQIGKNTEYGKIGNAVLGEKPKKTLLERQIDRLVKVCVIIAFALFLLVGIGTFLISTGTFKTRFIEGILSGITLAMAMIPEEFPVILTVFLSMGAWRLAKNNSLVKKLPAVETLGAISVLCVDKTGTITKNEMVVNQIMVGFNDNPNNAEVKQMASILAMASLKEAYDTMEVAIWNYAKQQNVIIDNKLVYSFPFTNETKMMGNVYMIEDEYILSLKGAYESILPICTNINEDQKNKVQEKIKEYSLLGLRVLAVAQKSSNIIIKSLESIELDFIGLVTFIDPQREQVADDIKTCYKAGIRVIMITGDNGYTASAIGKKIGINNSNEFITGNEIDSLTDEELKDKLKVINIFSRVIPEHKMRIVKCLQEMGGIVAMTGDGVNDAPALKKADIGIAMGMRGSEVSREAADLVLLDDDFHTIVNTVKDGRRIYDNIKKAVGYVFTIHIPIALASLMAPILGISAESLFLLPLHVVLMELFIDPTCSIVLERQPAEDNIMNKKPRKINESLIERTMILKSVMQGLFLFMVSFGSFYYLYKTADIYKARSFGLLILFLGNLFLVNVNSSNNELAFKSFKKLSKDKVMWVINIFTILVLILILYTPLNNILKLDSLNFFELLIAISLSFISIFWIEIVKLFKKILKNNQ